MQKSDPLLVSDKEQSEEEVIEEDIQHSNDHTPLINAQTKQINGKAKALYPAHAPPIF